MYKPVIFRSLPAQKWRPLGHPAVSGGKVGPKPVYLNGLSEHFRKCSFKPTQVVSPPQVFPSSYTANQEALVQSHENVTCLVLEYSPTYFII